MNKVELTGRVVADPDVRYSDAQKAFVSFTVAIKRKFKSADGKYESDFINCKAFNQSAEFFGKNFSKGDWIEVSGSIRTGSYEKDGHKVYTTDVFVDELGFVGDKQKSDVPEGFEKVNEGFM